MPLLFLMFLHIWAIILASLDMNRHKLAFIDVNSLYKPLYSPHIALGKNIDKCARKHNTRVYFTRECTFSRKNDNIKTKAFWSTVLVFTAGPAVQKDRVWHFLVHREWELMGWNSVHLNRNGAPSIFKGVPGSKIGLKSQKIQIWPPWAPETSN